MELTIEQALQQGVAAHKEGKLQDAERRYRAILQTQPAHPDANHNLGVLAVSVNKADEALSLFKTALEANPKIEQFWLSYIDALIKEKHFDTAKQVLEQAKEQGVDGESLNSLKAQLSAKIEEPNTTSVSPSKEQLNSLSKVNETKSTSLKRSQKFAEKRKKIAETKKGRRRKKQYGNDINPPDIEMNNLLKLYQNGRSDEAEKVALSLTERFPKHPFSWKVLGAVLAQTGRTAESLTSLQKCVQLSPQDAGAHYNLGMTLQELGRLKEAEANYIRAIALTPTFFEAHLNLGVMLKDLGRLEEAEASYNKVIALRPDFAEAHGNLGITLKELGRFEEAEASYVKAIALKPDFVEAHSNLGNTLKQLGRLEEAEASYTQAIEIKPDFVEAHYNLGLTLKELSRLEEAEASFIQAIILKPNYAEAHGNLGITLQEQAKLEEAEVRYRQAIALKSDYVEAHTNLGVTLKELGRLDEAEDCYRQAIALKPNYADARYNLALLLNKKQQYDKAAEQFDLVDTHLSKSYGIRYSYLKDKESVFFEHLDALIDQGELNAVIGSLSCSAEIRYGVRRHNPFCNEPLKYVVKTDLNEQYDFENIFAKTVRDILTDKSVSYKAQKYLTNGIQTAGNFFAMKKVLITDIEDIIRAEIEKYRSNFEDSEEGFIKNWPASYKIHGWLVRMQSGGKLDAHMHDNGWITGSVYINVPPKSKIDSGNLVLCVGDQKNPLGADKSQERIIDVTTGSLCFFPSSLRHYTVPFVEEDSRIVLAFDIIPKQ